MIHRETFWSAEQEAPLLRKNDDYITRSSVDETIKRAENWIHLVDEFSHGDIADSRSPNWVKECSDVECQRIFILDAERTFNSPENQQELTEALCTIYENIKDYHQGMSFITAFLLLFLPKEDVVYIILQLNRLYVPGYFKAASIAYFRDSRAFENLLAIRNPSMHSHITSLIPSETFCSKWFVGFNIHVLPFKALANFLDAFFETGHVFHFQYALALTETLTPEIMATKNISLILAYLRLDTKEIDNARTSLTSDEPGSFFTDIIENALDISLDADEIEDLRAQAMKELLEREEKRKKQEELQNYEDDEIVFSDEDE